MLKLLFALIMGLMAGTSISFCDGDDVSEVQDFFERNLKELRVEYKESFHEEWNVNSIDSIKKLYAIDDNHIGYLVDFDTGYLAYGLEYQMYKMETEGEPDFYNHSNRLYYIAGTFMEKNNDNFYLADGRVFYPSAKIGNGLASSDLYHEIESRLDYKGFRINASCTKIPKLKDKYDSSSWGNYKAVSFYQGSTSDCGVIAIMDLLHTFRLSGGKDYTKGLSPSAMREELRGLTNWQGNIAGEGMLPMDLTRGCTNYIGEAGVSLKSTGDYRDDLLSLIHISEPTRP